MATNKLVVPLSILMAFSVSLMLLLSAETSADESLVGYWKFEEGNGITALDSVGSNDGVIDGASWTSGIVGQALLLDGDDCVTVVDNPSLNFPGDLSIEGWVRFDQAGGSPTGADLGFLLAKNGAGPTWGLGYFWSFWNSPRNQFYGRLGVAGQPAIQIGAPVILGDWYHMVFTYEQDVADVFYLNGIVIGTRDTSGPLLCGPEDPNACALPNTDLNFGCRTNDGILMSFVTGAIDEIAVWNKALTPEEVLTHYENGLQGIGLELAEVIQCDGFEPPMANPPVKVKKNRALPLKAELFDAEGFAVIGGDLATPPKVQVWSDFGSEDAMDVSDEALPAGQSSEGNQFEFTEDGKWQFNLKTSNYTSPGIYTIFMESGDPTEYVIDPLCETQFVVK